MLKEKALEIAITQVGQEETPIGSNWGHPVIDYLASVGITFPAAWCMALLYWCFNKAAHELSVHNPMHKTGGVLDQYNHSHAYVILSMDLEPGDIYIMDYGHGLGHTGIIERMEGDIIHGVEGNTNNNGSRNGYAVERKERSKFDKKIKGFLRYK